MGRLIDVKDVAKMKDLSQWLLCVIEREYFGDPRQTIDQWITSQGGWVSICCKCIKENMKFCSTSRVDNLCRY